jgi:hypothetical protein
MGQYQQVTLRHLYQEWVKQAVAGARSGAVMAMVMVRAAVALVAVEMVAEE